MKVWPLLTTVGLGVSSLACATTDLNAIDTFYLNKKGRTEKCADIRGKSSVKTDLPYDPDFHCPLDKSDQDIVTIDSIYLQNKQTREDLVQVLSCVFQPIYTVKFTSELPDEQHNDIFIGGRGKLISEENHQAKYRIGSGTDDSQNTQHQDQVLVMESDARGNRYSLEEIIKALIHEVGHALGLDHTPPTAPKDLMSPNRISKWSLNPANAQLLIKNTLGNDLSPSVEVQISKYLNTEMNACKKLLRKKLKSPVALQK